MKKPKPDGKKYSVRDLIKLFRIAAESRNKMLKAGATDNVGAIHSATRILEILGLRVRYNDVGHINNLRHWLDAEFSVKARPRIDGASRF
jgi:hypothetical protein